MKSRSKKRVLFSVWLAVTCLCQGQAVVAKDPETFIYGKWYCMDSGLLGATYLHIEENRIYFDGLDFIEPHTFTKDAVKIRSIKELGKDYFKDILPEHEIFDGKGVYEVDLGEGSCLSKFTLSGDAITLNHFDNLTLCKVPNMSQHFWGRGAMEYVLAVPEGSNYVEVLSSEHRFSENCMKMGTSVELN